MLAGYVPIAGAYDSIATTTVDYPGMASITFSNIPQNYKHLQLRFIARSNRASSLAYPNLQFNNDTTSNYVGHNLYGQGASVSADYFAANTSMFVGLCTGANSPSNTASYGATVVDILDYTNINKNKTVRSLSGVGLNTNDSNGQIRFVSGLWMSLSPISSITIFDATNRWQANSSFALYGIKGD
jgi:hypothetical protein